MRLCQSKQLHRYISTSLSIRSHEMKTWAAISRTILVYSFIYSFLSTTCHEENLARLTSADINDHGDMIEDITLSHASLWSPWSLHGLRGGSTESTRSGHGVYMESTRSPHGV